MRGVNKVILVGTLGRDPETKYTGSGVAVTTLSVATSEKWKDKQGQDQEKTEWHRVVGFKRLAEIMGEYLAKGSQVYIEGQLQTRKWQDQSGADRYSTEIQAYEMQIPGPRGDHDNTDHRQASQPQEQQAHADHGPGTAPAPDDGTHHRPF